MPRADAKAASSSKPQPAWQTWVTVLLILHLFCLGWSVAANSGAGKSLLAPALKMVPAVRPYLECLWMNIAYDIHLASALPEDGAASLELALEPSDDPGELKLPIRLPPEGMQPRIRRQRYQQIANNVAFFDEAYAENSDLRTLFPLTLAERWLRELDAPHQPYLLVSRREPSKRLPKAVERAPSKPREGGPRLAGPTTYETATVNIHLVWNDDEGHYEASRAEPTGQTSEVVRAAAADVEDDEVDEFGESLKATTIDPAEATDDSPAPPTATPEQEEAPPQATDSEASGPPAPPAEESGP